MRYAISLCLVVVGCGLASAGDDETTPVFHSDVALGRIDTLVLDRSQLPIGGLRKEDFVLRRSGTVIPIRSLSHEDLPVDVLLLLDVSGSMRIHVQKVASAAHEALAVLGDQDRVGIMVFTTHTRVRLPFRQDLREVERKLDEVVESESFNGGTNINGALLDAAAYVEREGRHQVRHAVVIVTDDEAPACDQGRVLAALDQADAVLMVLQAPVFHGVGPYPGGGGPRTGQPPVTGPWPGAPGGIGGMGGPLGGVIFGRRRPAGPLPGSPPVMVGYPGGGSAGSPSVARASGGDSMNVNDAAAVETTFERIRQRYAIYFTIPDSMPEDMKNSRGLELDLADGARRRHPDATLQYRQIALAKDGAKPGLITRVPAHPPSGRDPEPATAESSDAPTTPVHRRVAVNDSSGPSVILPAHPGVEAHTTSGPEVTQVKVRRRGVSEPDGGPRVIIGPPQ